MEKSEYIVPTFGPLRRTLLGLPLAGEQCLPFLCLGLIVQAGVSLNVDDVSPQLCLIHDSSRCGHQPRHTQENASNFAQPGFW
jgi:hypothetical protein